MNTGPVEPMIFSGWILVEIHQFPFIITNNQCLDEHKIVGSLIILLPGVGWFIIGYESEPLPFYPKLRNCSYYVKLITNPPSLLLRFIYCVLISPLH